MVRIGSAKDILLGGVLVLAGFLLGSQIRSETPSVRTFKPPTRFDINLTLAISNGRKPETILGKAPPFAIEISEPPGPFKFE